MIAGRITVVTLLLVIIMLYEWPKMKNHPKKDKTTFAILLLSGWVLSMLPLTKLPGISTIADLIFQPILKSVGLEK